MWSEVLDITYLPPVSCYFVPIFFSYWRYNPLCVCILQPSSGAIASSCMRFLDHTQRRATVGRTSLDEWSVRSRDLYLTTLTTNILALGGIRTHDRRRRAAVYLRLTPRGYWDRQQNGLPDVKFRFFALMLKCICRTHKMALWRENMLEWHSFNKMVLTINVCIRRVFMWSSEIVHGHERDKKKHQVFPN